MSPTEPHSEPAPEARTVMMLQPGYLPWLGFFEQVYQSDVFVVYDDAQYTKQDWRNRNRIKAPTGKPAYLTVPVKKGPVQRLIRDVEISYDTDWPRRHANVLAAYYRGTPHFARYAPRIGEVLASRPRLLIDLCTRSTEYLLEALGIERVTTRSSELATTVRGKARLLAACRELGATRCYNGAGGRALYDADEYRQQGVELVLQDFRCPPYPQPWGGFEPALSVVDVLFNCGPEALEVIVSGGLGRRPGLQPQALGGAGSIG